MSAFLLSTIQRDMDRLRRLGGMKSPVRGRLALTVTSASHDAIQRRANRRQTKHDSQNNDGRQAVPQLREQTQESAKRSWLVMRYINLRLT